MTLTDFLLARIAEREANPWWPNLDIAYADRAIGEEEAAALKAEEQRWEAFVLAECEAKRRIVERAAVECSCTDHGFDKVEGCAQCLACHAVTLCDGYVLADLALPYADHPDYREEWRP